MREALNETKRAFEENEVPIGAVAVYKNQIIGRGHNRTEHLKDPTAHTEIIAITAAANAQNSWRLNDVVIYTTIEPCIMCAGALVLARVKRIVFGARDEKEKDRIIKKVERHFLKHHREKPKKKLYLDGITFYYNEFWFNLRKSNTQNVVRLVVEADTKRLMEEKVEEIRRIIKNG